MLNTNCMPGQANPKWMSQKSANLGADMALFGTPFPAHQPAYSLQQY